MENMKSFEAIRAEYDEIRIENRELINQREDMYNQRSNLTRNFTKENLPSMRELKQLENKLTEKIKLNEVKMDYLHHNALIALFAELMPEIMEILKQYANKPYGEKTKEKIKQEVKEKCGVLFRIYNDEYHIYQMDENGFTKYGWELEVTAKKYDNNLLFNNRIRIYDMEDLTISNTFGVTEYIEDIPAAIEALQAARKDVQTAFDALQTAIDAYNGKIVDQKYYEKPIIHMNYISQLD